MLNLFMAMLLDAFDSTALKNEQKEENKEDDLSLKIKMIKDGIFVYADRIKSLFTKCTTVFINKSIRI